MPSTTPKASQAPNSTPPYRLHNAHPHADNAVNPPSPGPPWKETASTAATVAGFLAAPSRPPGNDPAKRSADMIKSDNDRAFARLRPLMAKPPVAAPNYVSPQTRTHIEAKLAASGLPRAAWWLNELSTIRQVVLVRQALEQLALAVDRADQIERISRAKTHLLALDCVASGVRAAIEQAESQLGLAEPATT
jgi:hypothetical protein